MTDAKIYRVILKLIYWSGIAGRSTICRNASILILPKINGVSL